MPYPRSETVSLTASILRFSWIPCSRCLTGKMEKGKGRRGEKKGGKKIVQCCPAPPPAAQYLLTCTLVFSCYRGCAGSGEEGGGGKKKGRGGEEKRASHATICGRPADGAQHVCCSMIFAFSTGPRGRVSDATGSRREKEKKKLMRMKERDKNRPLACDMAAVASAGASSEPSRREKRKKRRKEGGKQPFGSHPAGRHQTWFLDSLPTGLLTIWKGEKGKGGKRKKKAIGRTSTAA